MAFKNLRPDDYSVTPYTVSKTITVDFNRSTPELSPEIDFVEGVRAQRPTLQSYYENPSNINPNGTYKKHVFDLINHFYYKQKDPYDKHGIENYSEVDLSTFGEGQDRIWVVKVSPNEYGRKIVPGSVKFTFEGGPGSTSLLEGNFVVVDDGNGNLFAENGVQVGNVFYANGTIVFTRRTANTNESDVYTFFPHYADFSADQFDFQSFKEFTFEFDNTVDLYEHEVRCVIEQHEFNGVSNPSVRDGEGGFIDYFESEDFQPFITTVGLYDDFLNLIAVGKLSQPVQKPKNSPFTIVVRFDT
jgi:hypothetical protein